MHVIWTIYRTALLADFSRYYSKVDIPRPAVADIRYFLGVLIATIDTVTW